jgi:PAS domain S-box-containing protein
VRNFRSDRSSGGLVILGYYGAAALSVGIALITLRLMEAHWHISAQVSILLLAVIVSTWLGGTKPGLFATVLAILALNYLLPHVTNPLAPQLVRLLSLAIVACYVLWLTATERRAAEAIRRNNEALRAENVQRQRTEEALRVSEAKFRALAVSAPAIIFIYQDTRILYANPAMSLITGYSQPELYQMNVWDIVHPDFRDRVRTHAVAQQRGEPSPLSYELKIITNTGGERWLDFTAGGFEYEGKPAIIGIACDITERKSAEQALQVSEMKFRALAEGAPAAIFYFQGNKIRYANPATSAITGYSSDELCAMNFWDMVHPDFRDVVAARAAAMERGETVLPRYDFKIVTKAGEERWLDFTDDTFDLAGKPAVVGMALDITDRKRAEEALRESQQLLQQVLATLPVGVVVTTRTGDITLINEATTHIWGARPSLSGPERWEQSRGWWHGSGTRISSTDWASVRALSAGQTSLNELIDIETFDGHKKTIQNSAAPVRDAGGQIIGAVIVNEDVTERVYAEEALQESAGRLQQLSRRLLRVQEAERQHLSRELHDEFGQLLAAIALHLRAAKNVAGEAAQLSLDESIGLLHRAGEQMRNLALELRPIMLETGGLDATLGWLAEQFERRTGIAAEVVGHAGDVSGDLATASFRVIQEALTNVMRHAQARQVRIELTRQEGLLELAIQDDGMGFDVDKVVDQATNTSHLGLVGMKERVEILGGTLKIDSQPGQGARIRVSLPEQTGLAAQHAA